METPKTNAIPLSQLQQNRSNISRKSYAQVVKANPTRLSSEKPWTEVKYTNKNHGTTKKGVQNQEPSGRRILFPRQEAKPKKSEEDIMLALNEALQKAGESASIRVSRIGYSQLGAISALLTEKADARELLKKHKNIFIGVEKDNRCGSNWSGSVGALAPSQSTRNVFREVSRRGKNGTL